MKDAQNYCQFLRKSNLLKSISPSWSMHNKCIYKCIYALFKVATTSASSLYYILLVLGRKRQNCILTTITCEARPPLNKKSVSCPPAE